jgi:hypothetical protein
VLRSILARLNSRKIVPWRVAFLAGAWLLLQVLSLVAQPFAWPDLVLRAATVVLGIGFFAALIIAWYHGEKGAQRVTSVELLMLAGILAPPPDRHRHGRGRRDPTFDPYRSDPRMKPLLARAGLR